MDTRSVGAAILRIDHLAIPLANGLVLGARVWCPADAEQNPVPAIIDYNPYRSTDGSVLVDESLYAPLAARGYACVRLDVRGTGNSDGLHCDQFDAAYWTDAVEALSWIAAQPWCNGRTGMTGYSWPGHASLMVASYRPASLGAILPVTAADDRYLNRYQGGCLLLYAVWHGAQLSAMHLRPPLPWIVGERWREMWLERLSSYRNYFELWGAHPTFDSYWYPGSAKRVIDLIACPMLAMVGWADTGYAVALPTLLKEGNAKSYGIVGPWGHCLPHLARPGPGVDFVDVAARWFDRTLKESADSREEWPALRAWLIESHVPRPDLVERPGYWVEDSGWPPRSIEMCSYRLAPGRLGIDAHSEEKISVRSPLTIGATAGEWMPWYPTGPGAHLPEDQREADALSLCFDGEPVSSDTELLGQPLLSLAVSSDQACGQIVARLCDVAPDRTSTRVTYGFLNLSHRDSDEQAVMIEPGQIYHVELPLAPIGWCLKAGHRFRIAISTNCFPLIWPAPRHATLTFDLSSGTLALPLLEKGKRCAPPAAAAPRHTPKASTLRPPRVDRSRNFKVGPSVLEVVVDEDSGEVRLEEDGLAFGSTMKRTYSVAADDPLSARCVTEATWTLSRDDWMSRIAVDAEVTSDGESFFVNTRITAHEGDSQVYAREDRKVVPRGSA